jgi:hypothetical protein
MNDYARATRGTRLPMVANSVPERNILRHIRDIRAPKLEMTMVERDELAIYPESSKPRGAKCVRSFHPADTE